MVLEAIVEDILDNDETSAYQIANHAGRDVLEKYRHLTETER